MRSRRTLAVIAALEAIGHTNVHVRWGRLDGADSHVGGPRFYHFTSDQQPTEYTLGRSLHEALDWLAQ